jgi:hypothetical protein
VAQTILLAEGVNIALAPLQTGGRIEVTIDATALAKGYMYVDSCHFECKITNFV